MVTREPRKLESIIRAGASESPRISSNSAKCMPYKRERADMCDGGEARLSTFGEGQRALDFAERP